MQRPRNNSSSNYADVPMSLIVFHPTVLISIFCLLILLSASLTRNYFSTMAMNFMIEAQNYSSKGYSVRRNCTGLEGRALPAVLCCGHRGARRLTPENTLLSFFEAISVGANCVELDVHRSSDGKLMVAHGRTVREKMLKNSSLGRIENMDSEFLKTLDAGGWFSDRYSGEKISTLSRVISTLWRYPILLVIELKYEPCGDFDSQKSQECASKGEWERLYAKGIVDMLVSEGFTLDEEPKVGIMFSSFNHLLVDMLAQELQQRGGQSAILERMFGLAYIFGPNDNTAMGDWAEGVNWVAPHESLVRKIEPEHRGKRRLISWVTDSLPLLKEQVQAGVSAVTTNDPTLCPSLCQWAEDN